MPVVTKKYANLYRDSVSLMQLSSRLTALKGIRQASVVMATQANLDLLEEAGLPVPDAAVSPNDMLVVVEGADQDILKDAIALVDLELVNENHSEDGERPKLAPRSIQMGAAMNPDTNLALISVPGEYAAAETRKALNLGLHVMLFSDNIAKEDEISLKRLSREKGLFLMGPDCGTAIINGIPLAFANVVAAGNIGLVGASGTGLQQVTCLIDDLGGGITQAIGTGGHDLSEMIGGITMLQGLEALARDSATEVIVLISKPPAPAVAERILEAAGEVEKPVVVNFLGLEALEDAPGNVHFAGTLESAARISHALATGQSPGGGSTRLDSQYSEGIARARSGLGKQQKYVRGLYSGGTFCFEATILLADLLEPIYSNTPVSAEMELPDVWKSLGHSLVDLGDDVFTRGRPHPMIDHRLRNDRILEEAADPETAVVLMDVVLGYGSHPDPAGEMLPVITQARAAAEAENRRPVFVGFICGTKNDPQNKAVQEARLSEAGVLLADSNAQAVQLAAQIVGKD
ncbi:MAG TPA: acyl-CoA synthetase FdrA [Anaerolineales bacterium]|nr:acyl-CoA synthetase FdrA [Anaerolineales bacterium]